jgi:hypothetical protein
MQARLVRYWHEVDAQFGERVAAGLAHAVVDGTRAAPP